MLISWNSSTENIYYYQRKCTHKKYYLIQHCCIRKPPTCLDYRKLRNACCRKAHFCIGRNSFPTFTLLSGMFPSPPHLLQERKKTKTLRPTSKNVGGEPPFDPIKGSRVPRRSLFVPVNFELWPKSLI
jgi:hypothetical protein